jgi:hypothetical protein
MLRSGFAAMFAFAALVLTVPADSAPGRGALFPRGRHIAAASAAAAPGASLGIPRAVFLAHPARLSGQGVLGCGVAVRIFGRPIRELWLAANWFRFPRAAPGPGRVAVRRHHVFVLERHLVGNVWLVFDVNSGGHGTAACALDRGFRHRRSALDPRRQSDVLSLAGACS